MNYLVSEIFHSIQGEGNYAGANSLFIRFQLCNLSCEWCDTKYTWSRKSGIFKEYTAAELKKIIRESKCRHIIFTGGEPALYSIDKLQVPGKHFHVESNGSIMPLKPCHTMIGGAELIRPAMNERKISSFNWVISPKLQNAGVEYDYSHLRFWVKKPYAIFKFVVCSTADLDEIGALAKKYRMLNERMYVGLEGNTPESQMNHPLVEEIVKRGWNFSPRLHVILWGSARRR